MKAVVVHAYGKPEVLRYEDYPDPVAGPGEVLIRVAAASINNVDVKRRSGEWKEPFPIAFPGILGYDVSGTIERLGPGAEGFAPGDRVFAMADKSYAELCAVKAAIVAKVPNGLDLAEAAVLPVVGTTGHLLITRGAQITSGQTVIILGAVGNVGRSAVTTARDRGAKVIAAVRKDQVDAAASLGVDEVVSTDDLSAIAKMPAIDAVADTVGGRTAEAFLSKVKPGGIFVSVVAVPGNAQAFPTVKSHFMASNPDAEVLALVAKAVVDRRLTIPINRKIPLKDAAAGHAAFESGIREKILLLTRSICN